MNGLEIDNKENINLLNKKNYKWVYIIDDENQGVVVCLFYFFQQSSSNCDALDSYCNHVCFLSYSISSPFHIVLAGGHYYILYVWRKTTVYA